MPETRLGFGECDRSRSSPRRAHPFNLSYLPSVLHNFVCPAIYEDFAASKH